MMRLNLAIPIHVNMAVNVSPVAIFVVVNVLDILREGLLNYLLDTFFFVCLCGDNFWIIYILTEYIMLKNNYLVMFDGFQVLRFEHVRSGAMYIWEMRANSYQFQGICLFCICWVKLLFRL